MTARLMLAGAVSCLVHSIALAGPLSPSGAVPATLEQTLQAIEASSRQAPSGIYALEASFNFNSLDAVNYSPATGRISLMGHFDPRFIGRRIPYLQHLAALLEVRDPQRRVHFTLPTPPAELMAVKNKLAGQKRRHEAFLAHFGDTFDSQGVVTHVGDTILTSLGLSPVLGHRRPGYFGASVEPLTSGAVRVVNLLEGSPADQAGLHAGDEIARFNGKVPFSAREFERLARFGGAGNKVTVAYVRRGRPAEASVELLPDDVSDLWLQATRWDVDVALYQAAGQQQRAQAAYLLGVLASSMVPPTRLAVLSALDQVLATAEKKTAVTPDVPAEAEAAHRVVQRLDGVFALPGNPMLGAYETEFSSSHRVDRALSAALRAFQGQTPATVDRLRDFAFNNPAGFSVPPSLFDIVYGSHAETKPNYYGEATNTPLARVLLEGDYTLKMLPHRPDLKDRISGYQTAFEYENNHPESAANAYERVWLSVAKMDVAQSASGTTLVIRDAAMRINRQVQTADGTQDAQAKSSHGYVDVLNSHYDELAADQFVLHEAREVAKLAAVAEWIRKKTPDFRLPKQGRVAWAAPAKVPSIGYMHFRRSGDGTIDIATHIEGGVDLTSFPQGSVGLVIPMDRGAPELRDIPNVRTPSPDAAAFGADGKSPGGWTTQITAGGKKATIATVIPPKVDGEMLRDAVSGGVADKASVDEQERKLRAKMAGDQGSPQQQAADALQLSQLLYKKGNDAEALALLKKTEALQPRNPDLLYYQAQYEQNAHNPDAAIASLQKAAALDPNNKKAHDWLTQLQTKQANGVIPVTATGAPVVKPTQAPDGQGGQATVQMGVPPSQAGLTATEARQPGASGIGLGGNRALRDLQAATAEQQGAGARQASTCYDGASGPGCITSGVPAVAVSTPTAASVPSTAPKPLDPITARNNIQMQINQIQSKPQQTPDDKTKLQQLNQDFQNVQTKIDNSPPAPQSSPPAAPPPPPKETGDATLD